MKKRTFAVVALAVAALAGCIKNDGSVDTPRAGILVDLLSPNANNTTIILNGNTIGSNVSYGSAPNLYNQVTPGTGNLSVFSSTTEQLLNNNFSAESGKYYSLFIVDSVSKMKVIQVTDSVSYPGNTDSVKVRFYNFAPSLAPLTLRVNDSATIPNFGGRVFETQQTANLYNSFLDMKAGTYRFQVFPPYSSTIPLKDTTLTFDGKHIYTVFIKGFYPDTTGTTAIGLGVVKHG